MQTRIVNEPFSLLLHGFGDTVADKQYVATGFRLMDQLWKVVKGNAIPNKGKNVWVYEPGDQLFAGVEIEGVLQDHQKQLLQSKEVKLARYAYYKHVGPYNQVPQAGRRMAEELKANGIPAGNIYIEIYGHWGPDESKLETELVVSL